MRARDHLEAPSCDFEIKIAVLGYVSAGKTTVINALLRDKFGEVSMRRTTAGVNCFRLSKNELDPSSSETTTTSTTSSLLSPSSSSATAAGTEGTTGTTLALVFPSPFQLLLRGVAISVFLCLFLRSAVDANSSLFSDIASLLPVLILILVPLCSTAGKQDATTIISEWTAAVLQKGDDHEGYSSKADDQPNPTTTTTREITTHNNNNNAESTLREITADNVKFRESTEIHVKYFDIQIHGEDSFFQNDDMLENTKLVLVDIPGINEAGAGGKYRSYVADHWDTFDCAIVVMDGRQGANTEEQVSLLEFIQKNNAVQKHIPVIILCNKVDDPEDYEQVELVQEVRHQVERIFDVPDRVKALQALLSHDHLSAAADCLDPSRKLFPAFIPTTAILAYIYRTAALMSLDQFQAFDKNLMEKLGCKEVGWKWRKLPNDQKIQLAYDAVSDPILYPDRMQETNFDKILNVLKCAVGSKDAQLQLIQKQMDVDLQSLSTTNKNIALKMQAIYAKCQLLGQNMNASYTDFQSVFWSAYTTSCENNALGQLSQSPLHVDALASAMTELVEYYKFASLQNWKDEQERTKSKMKHLVRCQFATILSQESLAAPTANWAMREAKDMVDWESLHPLDWITIFQSFLLLSYDKHFCLMFGNEKIVFETLANKWMVASSQDVCRDFGFCKSGCLLNLDAGKKGFSFGSTTTHFTLGQPSPFRQASASSRPFATVNSSSQGFGFGTPAFSFGTTPATTPLQQPPGASVLGGTRQTPFAPTTRQDVYNDGTERIRLQSITAMPVYEECLFEELRVQDYLSEKNRGTPSTGVSTTTPTVTRRRVAFEGVGTVASAPSASLFGSTSIDSTTKNNNIKFGEGGPSSENCKNGSLGSSTIISNTATSSGGEKPSPTFGLSTAAFGSGNAAPVFGSQATWKPSPAFFGTVSPSETSAPAVAVAPSFNFAPSKQSPFGAVAPAATTGVDSPFDLFGRPKPSALSPAASMAKPLFGTKRPPLVTLEKGKEGGSDDDDVDVGEEERHEEEENARKAFLKLAKKHDSDGSYVIKSTVFAYLLESLGTTYYEESHSKVVQKLEVAGEIRLEDFVKWYVECNVCMVSNKDDAVKCAACETPRRGHNALLTKAETSKAASDSGIGPQGFSFGSASSPSSGLDLEKNARNAFMKLAQENNSSGSCGIQASASGNLRESSMGESKATRSTLNFNYLCKHCWIRTVPRFRPSPSLRLMCPCCSSQPLNVLRQCDSCHTTFYLKTKDIERHYYYLACDNSNKNKDGRCSSGDERCDNRYKWKELPYASLNELLSVKYNSEDGTFRPKYPEEYKSVVHLSMPQSLSDPQHYGHVAWLYCQFMASIKESD